MTDFVKEAKLTELENKIPDISNLAAKPALTTVQNKIPTVSNLVKKTDYNTNITEIENKLIDHNYDKYITTSEFNTLAADVFNARLAQAVWQQKQILMLNCRVLTEKLPKINQNICLLKMNWKSSKVLIRVTLLARAILKKMVYKII